MRVSTPGLAARFVRSLQTLSHRNVKDYERRCLGGACGMGPGVHSSLGIWQSFTPMHSTAYDYGWNGILLDRNLS